MANPIQTDLTSRFLTALAGETTTGIVTRRLAKLVAKRGKFPAPLWLINDPQFSSGDEYVRVPTMDECLSLGTGFKFRGRPRKDGMPQPSTTPETDGVIQNIPMVRPSRRNADSSKNYDALVKTDAANTEMQQAVAHALGVDVLLGGVDTIPYVPTVSQTYIPWGNFETAKQVLSSGFFLPLMVTGPSGNGKTEMLEQICAQLGREYVRVNITVQTDEDDLLGGFRLVNGETKYALGPVPMAMLRGAVMNLDEVDLGGAAMMCLQPVLEGKPIYLKKIGRYISPAPGFAVVATANTKGRGDDGKYAHTTIMNEAMLERFAVLLEQGWPEPAVERRILSVLLKSFNRSPEALLVKHLVEFANVTRKNFEQQTCNDQIATRRLTHMVRVYLALNDLPQAMNLTMARFDADTAMAFRNLWTAIHDTQAPNPAGQPVPEAQPVV